MRKIFTKPMLVCTTGILAILGFLYVLSPLSRKLYRASFNRNFSIEQFAQQNTYDLKYNSFYFAGISSGKIFLANSVAPLTMVEVSDDLSDAKLHKIQITGIDSVINLRKFKAKVDSPYFYLMHGTMPLLLRGKTEDWTAQRFMYDRTFFEEAEPLGASSFALRSYSISNAGYELGKETSDKPHFEFSYDLLEKQIDGLFCVDGKLLYNRELKQVIYIYHYRNEFIVSDTNLNLLYRGHTIDTFSRARIKVTNIESQNYSMLTSPPSIINGPSCTRNNWLFIKSNLLANNENEKTFMQNSVVDVYDLRKGLYVSSIYLPNFQNKILQDIQTSKSSIFTINGRYLVSYDLTKYFEEIGP